MSAILSCEKLSVRYGSFTALRQVTLAFEPGRTCAIIGPNGAGKTTLINVLSGLIQPTEGEVVLEELVVTRMRADERAKLGLGRSFQIIKIFPDMSARENLRVAAQRARYRVQPFWRLAGKDAAIERAVDVMLERAGLSRAADVGSGLLSHGSQRALELGLTLMVKPSVLLLDEPLAGVGHHELPGMVALLRSVRLESTLIMVEHNMDAVMSLADEVVVMVGGEILVRGTPSEVSANPEVRRAYLGS
jgi:branched-chain amino acid transport system ATP-binding protein